MGGIWTFVKSILLQSYFQLLFASKHRTKKKKKNFAVRPWITYSLVYVTCARAQTVSSPKEHTFARINVSIPIVVALCRCIFAKSFLGSLSQRQRSLWLMLKKIQTLIDKNGFRSFQIIVSVNTHVSIFLGVDENDNRTRSNFAWLLWVCCGLEHQIIP